MLQVFDTWNHKSVNKHHATKNMGWYQNNRPCSHIVQRVVAKVCDIKHTFRGLVPTSFFLSPEEDCCFLLRPGRWGCFLVRIVIFRVGLLTSRGPCPRFAFPGGFLMIFLVPIFNFNWPLAKLVSLIANSCSLWESLDELSISLSELESLVPLSAYPHLPRWSVCVLGSCECLWLCSIVSVQYTHQVFTLLPPGHWPTFNPSLHNKTPITYNRHITTYYQSCHTRARNPNPPWARFKEWVIFPTNRNKHLSVYSDHLADFDTRGRIFSWRHFASSLFDAVWLNCLCLGQLHIFKLILITFAINYWRKYYNK